MSHPNRHRSNEEYFNFSREGEPSSSAAGSSSSYDTNTTYSREYRSGSTYYADPADPSTQGAIPRSSKSYSGNRNRSNGYAYSSGSSFKNKFPQKHSKFQYQNNDSSSYGNVESNFHVGTFDISETLGEMSVDSSRQSRGQRFYGKSYGQSQENYGNQNYYRQNGRTNKFYKKQQYGQYGQPNENVGPRNSEDVFYNNKPQREYNKERYTSHSFEMKQNRKHMDNRKEAASTVKKFDAASQRERLEMMITKRTLECLVCCESLKHADKVWSCKQCYHIFHLKCIDAWANSSKLETGWRCPACQNVCSEIPDQYRCFCGKTLHPKIEPGLVPHTCGDVCTRKGRFCEHKCTILCHPGPCPDCSVTVTRSCGCGATKQQVKCSSNAQLVCDNTCDKFLECGLHRCTLNCHEGGCEVCSEIIRQECFCGKVGRKVNCTAEFAGKTSYSCGEICDKLLSCQNHRCQRLCHEGECEPCSRDVKIIKTCPCGKMKLEKERSSCLDPIESCNKVCGKRLHCGQPNDPHTCKSLCHEGKCPPCDLTTMVKCRCGHMDKEIPCHKVSTRADDARCEKKCSKKRLCGKHRCNQRCCIEIEHICPLPCNHMLSCGKHRCSNTCHSGRCLPCTETSFEELRCECGAEVIYPPVPCGTRPPVCNNPCVRPRQCGHEANHACHTGPCPPCTVLCRKWCFGKHEQRSVIPCHQENFSCGLACDKPMSCGRHKCVNVCHSGPCPTPCKQPCTVERPTCGHPCMKPCHAPPCVESSCKHKVAVSCLCGVQQSTRVCIDVIDEFRNIEMSHLKDKIGASESRTVDISPIVKLKMPAVLKTLECTEECRVLERNRRLAIGLQIRNPDISQKLTPRYSDFMRNWAKKDANFCQRIHDRLTELVQLAKQSKQKSRSFSFESMNKDKRHFIHEYCEHFGCESAAYDMEPNRNIVATAIKEKSWLPSMSLLEVIQRENGYRKVPGPTSFGKTPNTKTETVSLKLPGRNFGSSAQQPRTIDYFNNPPS